MTLETPFPNEAPTQPELPKDPLILAEALDQVVEALRDMRRGADDLESRYFRGLPLKEQIQALRDALSELETNLTEIRVNLSP